MHTKRYFLDNGLEVFIQKDTTVPVAVINLLYKVGSQNDPNGKKGIAHLFEHLMFCNKNTQYDYELQQIGGTNNAYTNYDVTNYYCTVPAENIDRALWLEADRMNDINITQESLKIQQEVVTEELKQSYYNSPYGDAELHLMNMIFPSGHPYHSPVIGYKEDIASVTLNNINTFKKRHYKPDNAILVVSGNINIENIQKNIDKYFGTIDTISYDPQCDCRCCSKAFFCKHSRINIDDNVENIQTITRDIPTNALFYGFQTPSRIDKAFYTTRVLADILANGQSSIFHKHLVEEKHIFSSLDLEFDDNIFNGVFIIRGFIKENISIDQAKQELDCTLANIDKYINTREIEKAKNNVLSSLVQNTIDIKDRNDLLVNLLNVHDTFDNYETKIKQTTQDNILTIVDEIFIVKNKKILIYKK